MSLIKSPLSNLLLSLYKFPLLKKLIKKVCYRLEGAEFYSFTMRAILKKYYGVEVGKYSYGQCMKFGAFPSGVKVGNYSSIAKDVTVINHDHPIKRKSTHPFFYNSMLKIVDEEKVSYTPLVIGHDVWIGDGVKILSKCNQIGNGAIVAAGSVVTKDVLPFEIVAGVPAKRLGFRFQQQLINELQQECWWEYDIDLIKPHLKDYLSELEGNYSDG